MSEILVVGESLVDVAVYADGTSRTRPGGSPLNIAVGCARLGVPTVLATQIGDDEHGDLLRDHLDASDVEVRSLPPHRDDTSVARALLDDAGHATYEFDLAWDPDELPYPDGFSCVHVGSIATALAPGADTVHAFAGDAHRLGVPVSFDPNVRASITPDLESVRRHAAGLFALSTVVKLSDEDAELLFPGTQDVLGRLVDAAPTTLAVMTCGGRSVRLRSGGAEVEVTPPPVDVVDTIGAGDSFMSALLSAVVRRGFPAHKGFDDAELRSLGEFAARAAAITCTRQGADPPTYAELADPDEENAWPS